MKVKRHCVTEDFRLDNIVLYGSYANYKNKILILNVQQDERF